MSKNQGDLGLLLIVIVAIIAVTSVASFFGVDFATAGQVVLWGLIATGVCGFVIFRIDTDFWPIIVPAIWVVILPVLDFHAKKALWPGDKPWYGSALWQGLILIVLAGAAGFQIWRSRRYW